MAKLNKHGRGPVLLIHGGAGGRLSAIKKEVYDESLAQILNAIYPKLKRGLSAVEAACSAVELLENDPIYNAGLGSAIQKDGKIRMSASIMDGEKQNFAGCILIEGLKNPVRLARLLLKEEDRVLAGIGAQIFAREKGLAFSSPYTRIQRQKFLAKKAGKSGTVGAVVLDAKGHLAAATSTGGRGYERKGRVSDSATAAGNYASGYCAVSATGIGEEIVDFALAARIAVCVQCGRSLDSAATEFMTEARSKKAHFGFIAIDLNGNSVAQTTTDHMLWAGIGPGFERVQG